jgi:hypothetical protein
MGHTYDKISIVTIREIIEGGKRLEIPMSLEQRSFCSLSNRN